MMAEDKKILEAPKKDINFFGFSGVFCRSLRYLFNNKYRSAVAVGQNVAFSRLNLSAKYHYCIFRRFKLL